MIAFDRKFIFKHRISPFGLPINIVEIAFSLTFFLTLTLYLLKPVRIKPAKFLFFLFSLNTISFVKGVVNHYPRYSLFAEMRVLYLFILGYITFYTIVNWSEKPNWQRIKTTIKVIIVGSLISFIWHMVYMMKGYTTYQAVGLASIFYQISFFFLLSAKTTSVTIFTPFLDTVMLSITAAAIIYKLERAIWLTSLLGLSFIFLLKPKHSKSAILTTSFTLFFILSMVLFLMPSMATLNQRVKERFETMSSFQKILGPEGIDKRLIEARVGINEFRNLSYLGKIIGGTGHGKVLREYIPYENILKKIYYFHSSYIFYLVKCGLLTLVVFLFFLLQPLFDLLKVVRRNRNGKASFLALSLVTIMVTRLVSTFSDGTLSDPYLILFFGFITALCYSLKRWLAYIT